MIHIRGCNSLVPCTGKCSSADGKAIAHEPALAYERGNQHANAVLREPNLGHDNITLNATVGRPDKCVDSELNFMCMALSKGKLYWREHLSNAGILSFSEAEGVILVHS